MTGRPLHILVLTDRDWTHPQGGGTGTNLFGQIARWVAWGHRVTVVAGDHEGAEAVEELAPGLTVHRMGSRLTVFPRAAWATARGLGRDADVVLEVINGIAFFTPLWWWLVKPRVALVHHVHQDHYVEELGVRGRVAALLLERLPLSLLYRGTHVLTISNAAREDLIDLGVDGDRIHVAYLGVEESAFRSLGSADGARAEEPTLLYLGRLKQYKRPEVVLDVLEALPGARLDIAGDGDHRPALEAEVERRGLADRVTLHGFVSEEEKLRLYDRAWVTLTASSAEGWCLTVMAEHARPPEPRDRGEEERVERRVAGRRTVVAEVDLEGVDEPRAGGDEVRLPVVEVPVADARDVAGDRQDVHGAQDAPAAPMAANRTRKARCPPVIACQYGWPMDVRADRFPLADGLRGLAALAVLGTLLER